MTAKTVILASGSQSRRSMLNGAGVSFTAVAPDLDEAAITKRMLRDGSGGSDVAMALAEAKARAIAAGHPGALVIGSDQVLVCGDSLLSKAVDSKGARETLTLLRGREHRLISAAVIVEDGTIRWSGSDSAKLTMRAFSDAFLEVYLNRELPGILGSVGCYRIEGLGAQLFSRVEGDQFCVRGLPLFALLEALRTHGALEA